jgi:hypothetical protein
MNASSLPAAIRAAAEATGLIIAHGTWLTPALSART